MRVAVVTGGSRGIGSAIVKKLSQDGYTVFFTYLNSKENADKLESELRNKGFNVIAKKCNCRSYEETGILIDEALNAFGHIDVLVNNAGISMTKLFTDTSYEDWLNTINTNLTSCYNACHAVLPSMIREKSGAIVNISSIWGECGASMEVAYSASKAGVIGFTRALAKEVGPSGITVNAVAPGLIDTDMLSEHSDETLMSLVEEISLMRMGTPEEVAEAVSFLVSQKSVYITGQVLGVTGGF